MLIPNNHKRIVNVKKTQFIACYLDIGNSSEHDNLYKRLAILGKIHHAVGSRNYVGEVNEKKKNE